MLQIEIEKLPSYIMGEKKGRAQGFEQGLKQGMEKSGRAYLLMVAKRLLKKSFPIAEIAEITGLEASEIIGLENESPSNKD